MKSSPGSTVTAVYKQALLSPTAFTDLGHHLTHLLADTSLIPSFGFPSQQWH